jgi:pimeloyl-ACP methyl ester carboxylesterase
MLAAYPTLTLRRAIVRTSAVTPQARERFAAMLAPLSKTEIEVIFAEIVRGLHPEPGYRIPCPILIAHGDRDDLGNIRRAAPVWAARDGAPPPVVIPHAGHLANMDNPEAFNRVLMDFLAERYPVPGDRPIP